MDQQNLELLPAIKTDEEIADELLAKLKENAFTILKSSPNPTMLMASIMKDGMGIVKRGGITSHESEIIASRVLAAMIIKNR